MFNDVIYLNNTNVLGCIIALKNTNETEIKNSGLISFSRLQAKCTFTVIFYGFTPLKHHCSICELLPHQSLITHCFLSACDETKSDYFLGFPGPAQRYFQEESCNNLVSAHLNHQEEGHFYFG